MNFHALFYAPRGSKAHPTSIVQFLVVPLLAVLLGSLSLLGNLAMLQAQDLDINTPIFPSEFWEHYDSEAEALAKAESSSLAEQRKAAITLFLLSRKADTDGKALELAEKAAEIINHIYRRDRNNLLLAMLSGEINMAGADKSRNLAKKISYSNRGLANYDFAMPNIPNNLEAKQIYLRTTIYIPTYFKNLSQQQLQQAEQFLAGYEAAMATLQSSESRTRLEEFKTHVLILAAKVAQRSRKTRSNVETYLAQVDTKFFEKMKKEANGDLVDMYDELKK